MEVVDVIARHPLPEDLPVPRDLDNAVVFEHPIGSHFRLNMVRMGQQQGVAACETGRGIRRVVTGGKILTLPVVVLTRGPDHFAVAGLDLLVMVETPELFAVEIALNELGRFLARRIGAGRSHDDTAGKDACRTAGGAIVAIPLLDDVAVHIDDDRGLPTQRREHRITVPGTARIVDRRAGWKDGRPRQKDCRCRGQHRAANSSYRPRHQSLLMNWYRLSPRTDVHDTGRAGLLQMAQQPCGMLRRAGITRVSGGILRGCRPQLYGGFLLAASLFPAFAFPQTTPVVTLSSSCRTWRIPPRVSIRPCRFTAMCWACR